MIAPCRDCKNRFVSCHSSCEQYKEWRKNFDAEKERILKIRYEERSLDKLKMSGIRRMRSGEAMRDLKNRNYT